ncbi:MAG TPA: DNA polymerase III subunit gamma/tau [Polyangiaceae bacterium]|nr:DNA polymerase III subunit gamma/tau [Polyangiaceae bacterium]
MPLSYLVLARKWRPQTFDDLVGQEHVSRTLANAIATGRVAHAFLFTGVRGVGKTTSARIMAKALNCEKGPTATPCLVCSPCREIAAGSDVDVQEIDGASYNGVDEVRKLQESLPYRPARDRSKIFIVDEVHMLSQNAWNAFLKTLEEPPPHVKFIFATTEVHKVPVTILSRCQRYDFKLIPTQLIAKRLRHVLTAEKIEADDAAVTLIAREGAGSLRDAMSLLDQAIAWGGDKLVGTEVSRVLGVAARSVIHEIAKGLLSGDAASCLGIVADLSDQGYDINQVARGILAELRDLVVAKVCREPDRLLDLADEENAEVKALAASADADDLLRLHHGFSTAFDEVAKSADLRAALEMLLVRLARRPPLVPIDDLVMRLVELEQRLSSGGSPPAGPSRSAGGAGSAPSRPPSRGASAGTGVPSPGVGGPSPSSAGTSPSRTPPSGATRAMAASPNTASSVAPLGPAVHDPPSLGSRRAATPAAATLFAPAAAPAFPTQGAAGAASRSDSSSRSSSLDAWRAVLGRIRAERAPLASILEHASPIAFSAERVVLGYEPGSFLAAQATESSHVELLTRHVREYFGTVTPVAFDLTASPKANASVASIDIEERRVRLEQARRVVAEHPLVKAAIDILGAELKDVRVVE